MTSFAIRLGASAPSAQRYAPRPRRIPHEFYPTPPEAVRALLSVERFDDRSGSPPVAMAPSAVRSPPPAMMSSPRILSITAMALPASTSSKSARPGPGISSPTRPTGPASPMPSSRKRWH